MEGYQFMGKEKTIFKIENLLLKLDADTLEAVLIALTKITKGVSKQ